MSSREQIKVKRLSPSPKELRKAMKEASKEVAMWDFKLEWYESEGEGPGDHIYKAGYNSFNIEIEKCKNRKSLNIDIRSSKKIYTDIMFKTPTRNIDTAKYIAENIVRSIVCGIQGIAESNPTPLPRKIKVDQKEDN